MLRTKRSKEAARVRGRIRAREWLNRIKSDVATTMPQPQQVTEHGRIQGLLRLVFGINRDGTRDLLWREFSHSPASTGSSPIAAARDASAHQDGRYSQTGQGLRVGPVTNTLRQLSAPYYAARPLPTR